MFVKEEKFLQFVNNCLVQFVKLKFGKKENFIRQIEKLLGVKLSRKLSYFKLLAFLREESVEKKQNFIENVLGASSVIEICHLYLFYKLLTELFYETTWAKIFSPFYEFVFGKKIKIRNKKQLRRYAAKLITSFSQDVLTKKWIDFCSKYGNSYPPVIHFNHFVIGPLGFLLTPYHREKEILEFPKPLLHLIVRYTTEGEKIIDWEKTDIAKLFSLIVKEIENGIKITCNEYPIYREYLKLIGFYFHAPEWRKNLLNLVKDFRNKLEKNLIPAWFYELVQLSGMFLNDEKIIDILNSLIANNKLTVRTEIDLDYVKITKDSIFVKPKSWMARPAVDLAKDIEEITEGKKEFWKILRDILKKGAISYIEEIYDRKPHQFKKLLLKRKLYKFAYSNWALIPKETAIIRLLESYGFQLPSRSGFDFREELEQYLVELHELKKDYCSLNEKSLVKKTISLLKDGRDHIERILKEFSYILTSLVIYFEKMSQYKTEEIFFVDWPLFLPSSYAKERETIKIRNEFFNFWNKIINQEQRKKLKEGKFTLGDWHSLTLTLLKYAKNKNSFLSALPGGMKERLNNFSKFSANFNKRGILKWLNKASHESGRREIKTDMQSREKALNTLLTLDIVLMNLFSCIPPLIEIANEVNEVKTGLKFYEATGIESDFTKIKLKIYGTRFIDSSYTYYLIFQRKKEKGTEVVTYPILVTNLMDILFK